MLFDETKAAAPGLPCGMVGSAVVASSVAICTGGGAMFTAEGAMCTAGLAASPQPLQSARRGTVILKLKTAAIGFVVGLYVNGW